VTTQSHDAVESASLWELFSGFLMIGLMGFGGIAASAQYVIVEKRHWLTPKDFVEMFGICSVLPGGNFMNATVMIGDKFQGALGSIVGIVGLLLMPLLILIGIAVTYDHYSYLPEVRAATGGAASAAAGLIFGTAVRMGKGVTWGAVTIALAVGTFILVGPLRLPLWGIMLTMVPLSVGICLYRARRS
jgi:chromate transporter